MDDFSEDYFVNQGYSLALVAAYRKNTKLNTKDLKNLLYGYN